jgi:hypothetical protein
MNLQRSISKVLVAAVMAATPALAFAQDYYEDDIYYNPSKKKTEKQQQRQQVVSQASTTNKRYTAPVNYYGTPTDYAAADTYELPTGRTDISVDEYNRNGQFLVADSVATDSLNTDDSFACTRRIERFYNQDVVASSNDETLKDYYYAEDPVTQLNVYVIDPTWGWYGSPWAWRYYTPWYYGCYSPYNWGWSFGWDPYFSWSFGWGGSLWYDGWFGGFGWGLGHNHGWNCHVPDFGHGGLAMHHSSPGASQTHRPIGSGASATHSRSGVSYATSGMSRPGNMGRGRYSANNLTSSNRNTAPSNNSVISGNSRGRANYNKSSNNNSSSSRSSNNSYNNNNNYNNNSYNNNSFRSSGSSRTHNSTGSFGGGGGFGGGSHSSGGGGGRGRR